MKIKNIKIVLLFLLSLLFIIYWQLWTPGPKIATDFPFVSDNSLKTQLNMPTVWSEDGTEGLGEYNAFTLWSWPYSFISGILANLGLGFSVQERILYLIPFLLGGTFCIWKLCKKFELSDIASFVSSLFYLTNTYILLIIDGGQLRIALAYGLFPACFLLMEEGVAANIRGRIIAGLVISALGFLDVRFIFVLFLLGLIRFFYGLFLNPKDFRIWIWNWVKLGATTAIVFLGLNFYWLYPLIITPSTSNIFARFTQTSFLSFSSLGHSLLLLSPHWFKNIFGNISPLLSEFIFIPFFVFLSAILRAKNYWVGFWLLTALISIFLTKGSNPPLGNIYPWLFQHIPGFSLFRDSTKFFFLTALSYSILLGISIDEIIKRFKKYSGFKLIVVLSFTSLILFIIRPVWLGKMTGVISSSLPSIELSKVNKIIDEDSQFSRVLWIPSLSPLGDIDPKHPVLEASRLVEKRPFASGVLGTYEIFNFLREAPYMGEIFDIAAVGYIVYPSLDTKRQISSSDDFKYYSTFSNQLSNLKWLSKVDNLPVFKVTKVSSKIFLAKNTFWVIGSDDIYNEATKSANFKLRDNALVFAEETPGLGSRIDEFKDAKIILNNKTLIDLATSFINPEALVFPAGGLGVNPDTSGWWKRDGSDLIDWRYFLKTKYGFDNKDYDLGGGWAVAEKSLKLKIQIKPLKAGNVLLARALESSRSGALTFYQGNELVGQMDTKSEGSNVSWVEIGSLKNNLSELTIESKGDINVLNALAILPLSDWQVLKQKAKGLESRVINLADLKVLQNNSLPKVAFERINSTHYKIKVENVSSPTTLVFSENYSPYWKINNQTSVPLHSLINGFQISKSGEYDLVFEPQKNISVGLVISSIFFITLLGIILIRK